MRQEERDVYIIPPNFIEGGTLMGGMFKTRNTIEAGVLGVLTALPVLQMNLSLTVRIIILCLTTLPLVLVALIGVGGQSLSQFIFQFILWLRNRRVLDQSGAGSKKGLLPSWAQKEHTAGPEVEELPKSRRRFQVDVKRREVSQHKTFLEREEVVKPLNPLADYVPIEKITHGVIKTRDRRYVKVVEVVPVNFLLRSAQEQRSIIYSFISYLKIASVKVQFKVLTKRADIDRHVDGVREELARETDPHCRMLQEDYLRLIRDLGSREAITRRFFLIFEHEPMPGTKRGQEEEEAIASLQTAARTAANYLRQCGNTVLLPEEQDETAAEILYHILCRRESNEHPFEEKERQVVAEYLAAGRDVDAIPVNEFYAPSEIDFTHGRYICIDGVYYAYLLVPSDGFKVQVPAGWLSLLVNAGDTQTIRFYDDPLCTLTILKRDAVTKKPLKGAEFLVRDSSGAVLGPNNGEYITDRNGRIVLTDLTPGTTITAKETKTVGGYVLDTTPQSILIKSGTAQTLTFFNKAEGGLELIKVSASDKSQRIPNVTFEIREMDGGLVDTITTDSNGRVHLNLDAGDYYAVETEAGEGFKIDTTPHYFTISDGKTTTLTVTNEAFSGIIIHKVNSVTKDGIYGVKFLVYDQNKNPIGEYTTDDQGYIYIDDLTVKGKGKLFIRELEAAQGYELDKEYKTVYVQPGKTIEIEWENVPITGQFQIYKYAAEYNEVTGTAAGAPLKGAVYEISEARSGKVVDYITTDARGVAASKPLPLGRYKITEVTAPPYWKLSGTVFDETLEYSGQIIKLSDYDKPSNLGVTITKRGNAQALAGSQMRYDITVGNTSNVALSEFYWHDRIPTDATRATVLTTGAYSARLNYRVLYKTNYRSGYQVLASNLLTSSNYSFSLNAIPMQAGEYVTDVYFDFGKVPVGFQSTINPTLTVQVLGTVANNYQIINRADVGGKYQGTWQTAQATWLTIVRRLGPVPTLPKTGY